MSDQRDRALREALEMLREPLPFAPARLPAPVLSDLDGFMEAWSAECGLGDERARRVVRVYIEHCSPAEVGRGGMTAAAEFLLWFFALNDVPDGAEKREKLGAVKSILEGERVEAPPFTVATRRFRDGIVAAHPDQRLRGHLDAMFSSFFWEIENLGRRPSAVEYQGHREHTVAVYPYLDIYRASLGVPDESPLGSDLRELERLSVEIVYLVNDILSVARDHRKQKQNFVFSVAADRQITWEEAVPLAVAHLHHRVSAFVSLHQALWAASAGDARHHAYLSFLASYLEGNRVATLALRERYFGSE
jgi:Terpene synthase family 2, C-terminal metal binding